jgi:hypothetical protein
MASSECRAMGGRKSTGDAAAPIAAGYFGGDWDVESGEFAGRD